MLCSGCCLDGMEGGNRLKVICAKPAHQRPTARNESRTGHAHQPRFIASLPITNTRQIAISNTLPI